MVDAKHRWPACNHICSLLASTGSKLPLAPPGMLPHPRHSQCGPPAQSCQQSQPCQQHGTHGAPPARGPSCQNIHRVRRPSSKSLFFVPTSDTTSNSPGKMSQTTVDGLHTPAFLSWRKLQLSRAKLKASSKTSALLSGFAMVAMVEVQLDTDKKIPSQMLVAFAVCTTLLVAVHMLALMISTCILPNIEAVCNMHSISLVHESPHERLHWYIETAWAFSTLLGLLLFLVEIALLCWVKFYNHSQMAAWSASVLLVPVLIIFLGFAVHFYRSLVSHKYEVTASGIRELELLKEQIETAGDSEGRLNGVNGLMGTTQIV